DVVIRVEAGVPVRHVHVGFRLHSGIAGQEPRLHHAFALCPLQPLRQGHFEPPPSTWTTHRSPTSGSRQSGPSEASTLVPSRARTSAGKSTSLTRRGSGVRVSPRPPRFVGNYPEGSSSAPPIPLPPGTRRGRGEAVRDASPSAIGEECAPWHGAW